jgi:hypothetical protein
MCKDGWYITNLSKNVVELLKLFFNFRSRWVTIFVFFWFPISFEDANKKIGKGINGLSC